MNYLLGLASIPISASQVARIIGVSHRNLVHNRAYASCVAGMTGTHHRAPFHWLKWDPVNFLPKLTLNLNFPDLCTHYKWVLF
jgi:hypothetical protein